MPDSRQLQTWVLDILQSRGVSPQGALSLSAISGDAGFRQYFRVDAGVPLLAVMAPLTEGVSESAAHFAALAQGFKHHDIPVPDIFACDESRNFLLIECFQGGDLYDQLSLETVDALYNQALLILLRLQQISHFSVPVGEYNEELLLNEMRLFEEWFVEQLLGYSLSEVEKTQLTDCFDFLVEQALQQPRVLVHRDYHSRNLIYRGAQLPGVIDFQDAVWGPMTYDLVSLLRDCYIRWPSEDVKRWALSYGRMAYEAGVLPTAPTDKFLTWFDTMGLQRHIKVLGIFARLWLRDHKNRYLKDLPLVMRYTLEVAEQYPQTKAFAEWFKCVLLPLAEAQPWYKD